ncbi:hypothetical protein JCM11641_004990 [Rhodosporidiobolus odoratus]
MLQSEVDSQDYTVSSSPHEPILDELTWEGLRRQVRITTQHNEGITWALSHPEKEQALALLRSFVQTGAEELAKGCFEVETLEGEGNREGRDEAWYGLAGVLDWLRAIRVVMLGELPPERPESAMASPRPYGIAQPASRPPSSLALPPSSLNQPIYPFASASDLSAPLTSEAEPHQTMFISPSALSFPSAPPSSLAFGSSASKAAALAARMSRLASSAFDSSASTSSPAPLPSSFAPPPAAGALPKPRAKKPRASISTSSSAQPKRTLQGVVKAKGAGEVYMPPEMKASTSGRPQRKRKLPKNLTFGETEEEEDDGSHHYTAPASTASGPKPARDLKRRKKPPVAATEEEEIDELASDFEDENGGKDEVEGEVEGESESRFKPGEAVLAKYPNYSFFPSVVLEPSTAPPTTQGKRVKGAYLVKSIPSGADHRWLPPSPSQIRPVTLPELDEIDAGVYQNPPPSSWVKYRADLVEAARLIRDSEALRDWYSHPTDLETRIAAEKERKRVAKELRGW